LPGRLVVLAPRAEGEVTATDTPGGFLMSQVATRPRRGWVRFTLHYAEMVIAMFAGMGIFAALEAGVTAAVGVEFSHMDRPATGALIMVTYMALGMIIWMRIRGHGWAGTLEMSAVMYAPAVPLYPLLWTGVITADSLSMFMHTLMLPLMLAVMLRRRAEYSGSH
jgi:hypothetical protein